MRPAIIASLAALVAVPAFGQEEALPLVAILLNGLADGATVRVDGLGTSTVQAVSGGTYQVQYDRGIVTHVLANPEPCVFTYESHLGDTKPSQTIRLDLNLLREFKVLPYGEQDGLVGAGVHFRGGRGIMEALAPDGSASDVNPPISYVISSFTVADLENTGKALLALCHR